MKKIIMCLMLLSFSGLTFSQENNITPQMKSEVREVLAKAFGHKNFSDYYLVGNIKNLKRNNYFNGYRLRQITLETSFECVSARDLSEKNEGYCSVILTKNARKASKWIGTLDKSTQCYCGNAIIK